MSGRAVIGPLFTASGFQSWFLVCMPGKIVAVPMGLWFAITANKSGTLFLSTFGAVGGAVGAGMSKSGKSAHKVKTALLAQTPEDELCAAKGNITYVTDDLSALVYKKRKLGSSEIIVLPRNGRKKIFGIMNADEQAAIVEALADLYGPLVQTE